MKVNSADARTIIEMANVCYSEGIGPDYHDLLRRLCAEFPEHIALLGHQPVSGGRVVKRVMDDGVSTKDGVG